MLLAAGVGLGFAVEENVLYFSGFLGETAAASRFLTANLLHITATSLCGLYAYRFTRNPSKWGADFAMAFGGVVVLHGVYDTLLMAPVPVLGSLDYFAGTALAVLAIFFFQELRRLRPMSGRSLSVTALYVWGLTIIFVTEFLLLCAQWPFQDAIQLAGQSALASVLFMLVVLHELQEPLTD